MYLPVVVMEPWPRRWRTVSMSAPPASSQEAWEWRRSWVRGRGSSWAVSQEGYQIWV